MKAILSAFITRQQFEAFAATTVARITLRISQNHMYVAVHIYIYISKGWAGGYYKLFSREVIHHTSMNIAMARLCGTLLSAGMLTITPIEMLTGSQQGGRQQNPCRV